MTWDSRTRWWYGWRPVHRLGEAFPSARVQQRRVHSRVRRPGSATSVSSATSSTGICRARTVLKTNAHAPAQGGVEPRERLVQQQRLGLRRQQRPHERATRLRVRRTGWPGRRRQSPAAPGRPAPGLRPPRAQRWPWRHRRTAVFRVPSCGRTAGRPGTGCPPAAVFGGQASTRRPFSVTLPSKSNAGARVLQTAASSWTCPSHWRP